jgi:hypothetical protein
VTGACLGLRDAEGIYTEKKKSKQEQSVCHNIYN